MALFETPWHAHRFAAAATVAASVAATMITVGGATAAPARAASCTDVDVVVARGTSEPVGADPGLGVVVGNPVYKALGSRLSNSHSAYRVQYPASLIEPWSVQQGNRDLVKHVTDAAAACPNQRFVLVGYSQGANVVDNSIGISSAGAKVGGPIAATLPASVASKIAAILLFGNPIRGIGRSVTGPYAGRTYDTCTDNDPVCDPQGKSWKVHRTSYTAKAGEAADFAAAHL
ncbi:putative cutinase [Nocardia nova SH22a]|uniref:Putative cutinase n=1 Tax=Nocardia nova SH22a TaxID=1415166 RepID=W5TJX8_9NOCA|nr:cutinase family protein [Nocardia nova]AHH19665.1 putative cutinase [Nocardia nova SH22a]